jgi:hypothetical protein
MGKCRYSSMNSNLDIRKGVWSVSHPCRFIPGERIPLYPLDRVGPKPGLDAVNRENLALDRNGTAISLPVARILVTMVTELYRLTPVCSYTHSH